MGLRRGRIADDLDPVSEPHTLDQFGVMAVDATTIFLCASTSLKTMASAVLFDRQPFDRVVEAKGDRPGVISPRRRRRSPVRARLRPP
jgi:hypothetical protein